MANPIQSLNENFVYNSMLARALAQLLPPSEKHIIRSWLEKLASLDDPEDMNNRNEYMWFLLLMLQNKKLTIPFNKTPPSHKPRPLKDILPPEIYEEVLTATDQNMSWIEQASSVQNQNVSKSEKVNVKSDAPTCKPANFFGIQPMPKDGIICYMAAFSDHYSSNF